MKEEYGKRENEFLADNGDRICPNEYDIDSLT